MTSSETSEKSRTETEIVIGVATTEAFSARVRDAAKRIDSGNFEPGPSHLSFETMDQLLEVLTPNRWRLLKRLQSTGASSIRALAQSLHRDYRGVHADVMKLIEFDLVSRDKSGKILVPWLKITAEITTAAKAA